MCGFVASCVCSLARDTSHIHGHAIGHTQAHLNGHSGGDGGADGNVEGMSNGHTNGHVSSGDIDGHTNGHVSNGDMNGHTNGHGSNEGINGHTNGSITDHSNGQQPGNAAKADGTGPAREALAKQMQGGIDAIKHRGPDGSGVWVSGDARVGLGHCRLSINDLSPSGAQPLHSPDGLVHAVVNGEIYDHDRLRAVCAAEHGYRFTGESDSELVIALYTIHGAPGFFEHLRGEFAFVLYDERRVRVIAGRDRFGIKPLVWTVLGNRVAFAAEAKAFLALGWKPEWNVRGITDSGWMMDDRTVFKGVRKLMPGHWIEVTEERGVEIHKYWDAEYPDKVCARSLLPLCSCLTGPDAAGRRPEDCR